MEASAIKVLVVDDEESYRDSLVWLIKGEGLNVESATSGYEAIEVGQSFLPDILVVDWMLGDRIDGLRVAAEIEKVRPGLKTIVISGYPSAELRERVERAGVWAFLEKPFTLDDIRELLHGACEPIS